MWTMALMEMNKQQLRVLATIGISLNVEYNRLFNMDNGTNE